MTTPLSVSTGHSYPLNWVCSAATKVGLVSESNFTAPHAQRPVYFSVIASLFVTRALSVLAIPLTGGTSTLIRSRCCVSASSAYDAAFSQVFRLTGRA
jgi:hypothetical protein